MVAARSRILALWFTALLLASIIPAVAPVAAAAGPITVEEAKLQLRDPTTLVYSDYPTNGRVIRAGDELRISIRADVPQCDNAIGGTAQADAVSGTATLNTLVFDSDRSEALTFNAGVTKYFGNISFRVKGNFTGTQGIEGPSALSVSVSATCPAGAVPPWAAPAAGTKDTDQYNFDTRSPRLNPPASVWTNASGHYPVTGSTAAAIDTTVTLTPSVVEANLQEVFVNFASFGWGGGDIPIPTTLPAQVFKINDSAVSNKPYQGTRVPFGVRAVDAYNNVAASPTTGDAWSIAVDNVRPTVTAANFRVDDASLHVAPGVGASRVNVNWASEAPATDISRALVTVKSNENPTGTTAFAATGAAVPLTFANPYAATVNVTLNPIDSAGNINTLVAISPPFIQAAELSVQYGGTPGQPIAVTKSGVFNVYVNTTNALAPTPTYLPPTAPVIYGQLVRNLTPTTVRYWENGTEGSNNANHFQDAGTVNTGLVPDGDADPSNTAFQPLIAVTGPTSTKGAYIFNNLSDLGGAGSAGNREFLGGNYQLHLNVSSGSTRTNLVRYFAIDGDLPAAVPVGTNLGQNNNYTRGTGLNWTDVHGADGNPFRVYYAVHDSRSDTASGSLVDSKLRNVTFELVTLDGAQVAKRTRVLDDPATPADERLARVDINVTLPGALADQAVPYFYDFRDATLFPHTPAPADVCGSGQDMRDACIWWRVRMNNNWSMSWFNETNLSGWVNLTYPDLPPGKFKVRVLAYDRANGLISATYPTSSADNDVYKVAPAVKILDDATSPLLTEATINGVVRPVVQVSVLGSQRYLDPPNNSSLSDLIVERCVRDVGRTTGVADICPPEKIEIFLSNAATGTNPVAYDERSGIVASIATRDENLKGFVEGSYTDSRNGTPAFSNTGVPIRWFYFNTSQPEAIPSTIDVTKDIYVRAVAHSLDANGGIAISRSSDWIRVISAKAPALKISEPSEWQLNITSATGHAKPPFTVQFDRKGEPGVPTLSYSIKAWSDGATVVPTQSGLAPRNHANNVLPHSLFNWSAPIQYPGNSTKLPQGAYQLRIDIMDGTHTLATAFRNFTIVDARPVVAASSVQTDPKLLPRGTGYTVGRSFDINITTDHDDVNLSGFVFALKYPDAPAGTPTEYTSNGDGTGTNGFRVTVTNGLPLQQFTATQRDRKSDIIASVELPAGVRNQALVILEVTAVYNHEPWTVGNTTKSILLTFDGVAPAGTLLVADTVQSVFVDGTGIGSIPGKNKEASARKPSFTGFVEDFGSGIKLIEVRLVDLTDNKTLLLDPSGSAIPQDGTEREFWTSSAVHTVGTKGVQLVEFKKVAEGRWLWWLNTTGRANITPDDKLYVAAENQGNDTGIIRLDHRYRVDVRFTDNLDQTTAIINSTEVDFDPTAPFLGYGGFLGTPNNIPSGIWTKNNDRKLNWHGANDQLIVSVNLTDNHCIRAVRLVGNSSINPATIVKANMTPNWSGPAGKVCPSAAAPVEFTLDLAKARNTVDGEHFFNDVATYDLWWEAEDWSGQVAEIPATHRKLKIEVLDTTPASVETVWFDPPVGQAGGRATIRARVFENLEVSHVMVKVGNRTANMTPETVTPTGTGVWRLDTTDDLQLALDVGEYVFNVTPYDVNWNRTIDPTCPQICFGQRPLYIVRDDGAPAVLLDSPAAGATINATPTITLRALHKALETSQISVKATTDGNASNVTAVPAEALDFTELKATNGTRQGWTITYTPGTLDDNTTLIVNVSAALASLVDAKQYSFIVDSQAPSVTANVTGTRTIANKTFAVSTTRVVLAANDTVSTPIIKFSVNGGAEQTYTGAITPAGPDGEWKLEYWATDPAGNVGAKQTITLAIDDTGPRITVAKHGDEVLLTVTDGTGIGLNESTVTVHYRYGAATAFSTKKVDKLTANSFGTTLPGNATADGLSYYFTAEDMLGNVGTNFTAAQPYTIAKDSVTPTNLPPTIRITAPTAGASVRNSVELRWLAEDPEEAPLTISIALRDPAPGRVLVAAGENSGAYTVNTTGFAAGPYTVVVTVNDGENSASAQVTFTVESGEVVQVRNVPPASVPSGTAVSVAVALNPAGKTVAQATYRLMRDGALASSGPLTPQNGLYAAGFTPSAAGNYAILVDVVYTDGSTEPAKQVATFRVPGTVTPPEDPTTRGAFPVSLMALVAIAVLTVALGAYGAFGRWKK